MSDTANTRPPVTPAENPSISGFLSIKEDGSLEGPIQIDGADYNLTIDAAESNSKAGRTYYKFSAIAKNGGENFQGASFRTMTFGTIGKPGFRLLFELNNLSYQAVAFLKDKNRDGKPYKSPLYILSPDRPYKKTAA